MNDPRYEHFSRGDLVRIERAWRSPAGPAHDRFAAWDEHPAGLVGHVTSLTNAGFRGLEYCVQTAEGSAHGISPVDLTAVRLVEPSVPWPTTNTHRGGVPVRHAEGSKGVKP